MPALYTTSAKRHYQVGEATVTLNGSGTGTAAVVFDPAFVSLPKICVVTQAGDSGTIIEAVSPAATKSGFTVSVTTSLRVSQDIQVTWFACTKA